jgi:hypothetical protein
VYIFDVLGDGDINHQPAGWQIRHTSITHFVEDDHGEHSIKSLDGWKV